MSVEPMRVTIEIEMSALIALIDSESSLADVAEAQRLGLLSKKRELTPIGQLTLAACDVVYLRHKLIVSVRTPQEG